MRFSYAFDGIDEVKQRTDRLPVDYKRATAAALYQAGSIIVGEAVLLVPVDTGRLRSTHYVAPPRGVNGLEVEVGFGTKYARRQHNETGWRHTYGEALYLLKPMNRMRAKWRETMARLINLNVERRIGMESVFSGAPKKPKRTSVRDKRGRYL